MSKPKYVKDYDKVSDEVLAQIKLAYPYGFEKKLIRFTNKDGKLVSALPFETEEIYYLIRMTLAEAQQIVEDDNDYDDDGNLMESAKDRLEDEIDELSPDEEGLVDEVARSSENDE